MRALGSLAWLVLGGFIGVILWGVAGIVASLTIIGIPVGIQCFKIAVMTLHPFGMEVDVGSFGAVGLLANIIWVLVLGWELCLYHLTCALLCAVTIIGIPFAFQHVKLARLSLIPFGAEFRTI